MTKRDYVTAVYELIDSGMSIDEVLSGLDRVLASHGHESLKPAVLKAVLAQITMHTETAVGSVAVVRTSDLERYKSAIASTAAELNVDAATLTPIVEEDLIGGFRVITPTTSVDRTYKRTLLELYRAITHSTTSA